MKYIGIDVHKRISTVCVIDENNKTESELLNIETSAGGFIAVTLEYRPDQCKIAIENSTRSHFVQKHFRGMSYDIISIHPSDFPEIAKSKVKNDTIDARKLAELRRDMDEGRRKVKVSHMSSDENMKRKALCRVCAECTIIKNENILRIWEYLSLHDIKMPAGYKSVDAARSIEFLKKVGDPALTIMVSTMELMIAQIEDADAEMEHLFADDEDVILTTTIKGIGVRTAATIVTAIDGIERFDSPEKLVSFFGLDPATDESAGKRKKGKPITKEGDPLVRYSLANAVVNHARYCPGSEISKFYKRMSKRMPHWKAVTAAARKMVCVIWAMLTRGESFRMNPSKHKDESGQAAAA